MSNPNKVLVVEDEPLIREAIVEAIAEDFDEVLEAADGEEALQLAARETPGLVVLDLMLPGVSGIEVCRRMRADWSLGEVPIVILTAHRTEAEAEAAFAAGASDYLVKPFAVGQLRARLRTLALRVVSA